jgi:NitT/TauT family transport system substrate-binding protein
LAAAGAALAAPWLGGCGTPEPMLRIASNVWPGYETLYLARTLGRYDERRIRLVEMPSATDVLRALSADLIEGAALTLDEMLGALDAGLDLVTVLVFDVSHGADVLMARSSVADLAGLAGRRIGVEQTAVGALMLNAALHAARLAPTDVRLVYLTVDRQLAAFESGSIDAVVTFDPVASALARQGARRLFDSSQMPGAIVDVLALQRRVLQRQPQALRSLIGGHFHALNRLRLAPTEMAPLMAPRLQQTPAEVLASLQGMQQPDLAANRIWLGGNAPQLQRSADALQRVMLSAGLLGRPLALNHLCDPAWLPQQPDSTGASG